MYSSVLSQSFWISVCIYALKTKPESRWLLKGSPALVLKLTNPDSSNGVNHDSVFNYSDDSGEGVIPPWLPLTPPLDSGLAFSVVTTGRLSGFYCHCQRQPYTCVNAKIIRNDQPCIAGILRTMFHPCSSCSLAITICMNKNNVTNLMD